MKVIVLSTVGVAMVASASKAPAQVLPDCDPAADAIVEEYRTFRVKGAAPSCKEFIRWGGSEHFTWEELNGGFSNGNPHAPWGLIRVTTVNGLERIREIYARGGIKVSSGYRCPHGNEAIQGHPNSGHMFGTDLDLFATGRPWTETEFALLRLAAVDAGANAMSRAKSVRLYGKRAHLHIAFR